MVQRSVIDGILESMGEGLSLRKSAQKHGVSPQAFLREVDASQELQEQYAQARARMLDVHAEELEDIGERASMAETATEVAGLRLLSDNRKWLLSKLAPKKYGDKVQQEVTGADGGPLQAVTRIELVALGNGSGTSSAS